jgi:hypothetical protein
MSKYGKYFSKILEEFNYDIEDRKKAKMKQYMKNRDKKDKEKEDLERKVQEAKRKK